MEKNNNYKIISVIGLVIAVVALAVGFAAYSTSLTINPSVTVSGDEFSPYVVFDGTKTCSINGTNAKVTSAGTATGHEWSGIDVVLSKPGDSVTCTSAVQNASLLEAFLEKIQAEGPLTCTSTGTSNPASNYDTACAGIELNVAVDTYDVKTSGTSGTTENTLMSGEISEISIDAKNGDTISKHTVTVTITYNANASVADGDFKVNIPTISLTYNTED